MPLLDPYSTGTIDVVATDTAVAGAGTLWTQVVEQGDLLVADGMVAVIDSVTDDTHLVLFSGWPGSTLDDHAYEILQMSPLRYEPSLTQAKVRELLAALAGAGIIYSVTGDSPDPEIGEDGQYALKTNSGAWQFWLKVDGVWQLQSTPVGANWQGEWDGGEGYVTNDVVHRLGSSYIAVQSGTNKPPESEPTYWDLQTSAGGPGRDGGVIAIPYVFDGAATADSDPGNGKLRRGPGASQKAATVWRADLLDSNGNDWTSVFTDLASVTSAVKAAARIYKLADQTSYIVGNISAIATPSGYRNLTFAATGGADNPFTDADELALVLDRNGDKGDTGATGPKGLNWHSDGTWSNATTYALDDAIRHDGSSYRSLQAANLDKNPASETSWWALLAEKGAVGATGSPGIQGDEGDPGPKGMQWEGAWDSGAAYVVDGVVSRSGKVYIAIQNGTNQDPLTQTAYWDVFFDPVAPVNEIVVQNKATDYTALASDRGTLLNFATGATLSLTAASTLANGWFCHFKVTGGALVINPDGSEEVDGATTKSIAAGGSGLIICSGTGFITFTIGSTSGLSSIPEDIKTDSYSVAAADQGRMLVGNKATALTFTLPSLSSAGAGFTFMVRNIGVGQLTIDGASTETIEVHAVDVESFILQQGEQAVIYVGSEATKWRVMILRSEGHVDTETDVATASTMDIGATNTERVRATGTTGVTSFGTRANKRRRIRWTGAVTVTHHATSLILPGGENAIAANNDIWIAESDTSGNWRVIAILPASGLLAGNNVTAISVTRHGAQGDGAYKVDGAITTGTPTFTSATAGFTASDVGKIIRIVGAGAAGATLSTTILGYTNATTVTLANNAGTSVTGATFIFGTDDTASIQAAIDAATSAGTPAASVYLPNGLYVTTSELSITQAMLLFGDGKANSFIFPALDSNGISVNTIGAVTIEQLQIFYISKPSATYGIKLDGSGTGNNGSIVRDVQMLNPYIGIGVIKAVFYTLADNRIFTPDYAGMQINHTGTPDAGNGLIEGNFVQDLSGTKIGIEFTSGGGTRIIGNYILNAMYGVKISLLSAAITGQLTIANNHFDGIAQSAVHASRQGATGTFRQLIVSNNHFAVIQLNGIWVPSDANGVWLTTVTILGNDYSDDGTTTSFLALASVLNFIVAHNSLQTSAGGTSVAIITDSTADRGIIGPNIKTGTWAANNIGSTNTTTTSPT